MGKETYLIEEYWHDEVTAYCTAFGILGEREEPKEGFYELTPDIDTDFERYIVELSEAVLSSDRRKILEKQTL